MLADDRVTEWAASLASLETSAFMRARRRFLKHPCTKHLRRLHAAAARLRSLLEDFRDVLPSRKRAALQRVIEAAGEALRARRAYDRLRDAVDTRERREIRVMLRELRAGRRRALGAVRKALAHARYAS